MNDYKIRGTWADRTVCIETGKLGCQQLMPQKSQEILNHSPDGFSWGYGGSGPSQLALALLLYYLPAGKKNEGLAVETHTMLKDDIISHLPQGDFDIDEEEILNWIRKNIHETALCAEGICDGSGKTTEGYGPDEREIDCPCTL